MNIVQKKTYEPIKNLPLHNPGQSLESELNRFIDENVMGWGICIAAATMLVAFEWYRWLFSIRIQPVTFTIAGLAFIAYFLYRLFSARRHAQDLQTGLIGERAVGQYLQNALLRKGYWVVHDICEDGYNIDHVVIGIGGVFSIETKTRRKPGPNAKIDYGGNLVKVAGWSPDRDPVAQAKACATRLQRILLEETGLKVNVRAVVLYPGWFVNAQPRGVETWVLNEKSFVTFVEHESDKLSQEEVFRLAAGLGRYVRRRQNEGQ